MSSPRVEYGDDVNPRLDLYLNVAGLNPGECTAIRELLAGLNFTVPAKRLQALRPFLFAGEKRTAVASDRETKRLEKRLEEELDATLFAHAYGRMYGMQTLVAMKEQGDGDAVMCFYDHEDFAATRVQVKGIRDPALSRKTLNEEIAKLGERYPRSHDLIVVVAIHAKLPYPLRDLEIPPLNLGALYILTAPDDRLERWQLVGDFLAPGSKVGFEEFEYPKAEMVTAQP